MFEAGKRVIIRSDSPEDESVRGKTGVVFAYVTSGVWITLDEPIGDMKSVRVRPSSLGSAVQYFNRAFSRNAR